MEKLILGFCKFGGGYVIALILLLISSFSQRWSTLLLAVLGIGLSFVQGLVWIWFSAMMPLTSEKNFLQSTSDVVLWAAGAQSVAIIWAFVLIGRKVFTTIHRWRQQQTSTSRDAGM